MNYRSFQITPKRIIFISLIGIVLILLVIKASWYSREGLDTILDTLKSQGIDTIPKKLDKANLIKENLYRNFLKLDDPQAKIALRTAIIENKFKLTKEGQDKLLALVNNLENMKNAWRIEADDIFNKKIAPIEARIKSGEQISPDTEKEVDSYIVQAVTFDTKVFNEMSSEYIAKYMAIMKDYKMPEGYVEPSSQVTDTTPTVPEPATESTLNKTNQLNVEDAAPNYPSYKYKGCWSSGNDTQYPILKKMVVSNISNMDDCVGKISQVGLPSVAYDGKSLCFGGDNSYSEYNSTNCESTYGQGKSWLVYSKNN